MAVHFESTNQEYGIRRVVSDDPHNDGKFVAKIYCAVTGNNLCGIENIRDIEVAKSRSLKEAKKYYT